MQTFYHLMMILPLLTRCWNIIFFLFSARDRLFVRCVLRLAAISFRIFFHPVDNAHLTDPAVPLKLSDGSGDGLSFARRYRKLEQRGAAEGIEPPFSVCAESVFVGIVYVDVTNALVCVLLVEANAVIVARQICGHKLEAS